MNPGTTWIYSMDYIRAYRDFHRDHIVSCHIIEKEEDLNYSFSYV